MTAKLDLGKLTRAEMKVLTGMLAFKTHKEIAAELGLSEKTVKFHACRIYRKNGLSDRQDLFRAAVQQKILVMRPAQ